MKAAPKTLTKLMLILAMLVCGHANAWAIPVICELQTGIKIDYVIKQLPQGVKILDKLSDNTAYLLDVPALPATLPLGVNYFSPDFKSASIPAQGFFLFNKSVTNETADWYRAQPAIQKVNPPQITYTTKGPVYPPTGKNIIIADINSVVDYSHPALRGHLIAGWDFVAGSSTGGAGLDQSSASFLDQSSASFLDQSSASFLDQSSAAFLDQSSAAFLDQSSASFLDQSSAAFLDHANPAHGHGTLVAGILAAVAPDAMIMPIRTFDDDGNADEFRIAKAIEYAIDNGANVINMSFGMLNNSQIVKHALDDAAKAGVVLVASAGNNNTEFLQFPAGYSSVVSVAAITLDDKKAGFSNFSKTVNVSSPGVNIISAYPNGLWAAASGTSFAAPIVAGEAALFLSSRTFSYKKDGFDSTSFAIGAWAGGIDANNPAFIGKLGTGRIDMAKSVGKKGNTLLALKIVKAKEDVAAAQAALKVADANLSAALNAQKAAVSAATAQAKLDLSATQAAGKASIAAAQAAAKANLLAAQTALKEAQAAAKLAITAADQAAAAKAVDAAYKNVNDVDNAGQKAINDAINAADRANDAAYSAGQKAIDAAEKAMQPAVDAAQKADNDAQHDVDQAQNKLASLQ